MWKKVDDFIIEQQMFTAEDVVIAGVSGGADSMCLLFVLEEWKQKLGFQLVVVHVNHGLREAAEADEQFVKMACEEKGILFEARYADVRGFVEQNKVSEEEAGRILRRRIFEQTAEKYKGTRIALAHHMNDNAETFLLNLARGSRLAGLGGMKPVSGRYVRPLLKVTREEIENYLTEHQVSWCTDESNATDKYTRNRIRNHVIPFMEREVNAKVIEHMSGTMEYLRAVQEYLEKQMAILWKEDVWEQEDGSIVIRQKAAEAEPLVGNMVLRKALAQVSGSEKDLEEIHVELLRELFEKQTGRSIDLPYQVRVIKCYQGVHILKKTGEAEEGKELVLPLREKRELEAEFERMTVKYRVFERGNKNVSIPKKTYTKWFDYDIIKGNVSVRTRRAGDRIVIDEKGRTQKLKNYFINEKISSEIRDKVPVIAEGEKVLWIVGYRQSKAYQISEDTTTILEVEIHGGRENGRKD